MSSLRKFNTPGSIPTILLSACILISRSFLASISFARTESYRASASWTSVRDLWYRKQENFLKLQTLASERASVISSITSAARLTFQSSILGLGAYLAIQNIITPGMMIAASILMGMALRPVQIAIVAVGVVLWKITG